MRLRLPWSRQQALTWSVVTSAPGGEAGEQWGDTWFARDLVAALQRQGHRAAVVSRAGAQSAARDEDDVVIVLRGLRGVTPRPGNTVWMLWVISHPELVEAAEAAQFDVVFAASRQWSRLQEFQAIPLLQATDPARFSPAAGVPDSGAHILFVGSTRGQFRPIVRDAIAAGADITLFGVGWQEFVAPEFIQGDFIANTELPHAYATAGIVLNDHWADMAAEGFLSNRLFDAAATGVRVLSDEATGLREVFGDTVRTYRGPEELSTILDAEPDMMFADRATRLVLAATVAREHSFDARAVELIAQARRVRRR